MGNYDKKVLYLDYLENEVKIKNAGFAKLLQQGEQYRLSVNINGLHATDTLKSDLCVLTDQGESVLDTLYLQKGKCTYSCLFTRAELQKRHAVIENAYGICVKISGQRCLKAVWRESNPALSAVEPAEELQPVLPEVQPVQSEPELIQESIPLPELQPDFGLEKESGASARISDDKWEQLEHVFPLIHPFGDEKEYLSLTPGDFIILNREYQTLANNSFLLHGFYNYHHIILGKIIRGGQEIFYLGVPGVFYEREKTVAIMFGFESFECAKEPAETGTFGYYMKRVEI